MRLKVRIGLLLKISIKVTASDKNKIGLVNNENINDGRKFEKNNQKKILTKLIENYGC